MRERGGGQYRPKSSSLQVRSLYVHWQKVPAIRLIAPSGPDRCCILQSAPLPAGTPILDTYGGWVGVVGVKASRETVTKWLWRESLGDTLPGSLSAGVLFFRRR